MKFNHGHWLKEKGMECLSPTEMYDTNYENDGTVLKICAPVRRIYNRGCTLNVPVITIRISIPAPGVFTVKLTHFEGQTGYVPAFDVNVNPVKLEAKSIDGNTVIENDGTRLVIKNDMTIEFYRGEQYLTRIKPSDIMYVRKDGRGEAYISPEDVNYMCAATNLSVDEHIYGLGERFTPFVKNGQVVEMWNDDGGTSTQLSYKNVPFYMSDRGYGVFVNNTGRVEYEVGSELAQRMQFSVEGESLEFFVICGDENEYGRMKDVLVKYTGLTGRPPILPAWSFGLWLSTSFTTDYDENTVMGFIDEMERKEIPLSVFHFDCFWMKGMSWCNFKWDDKVFSEPAAMLARIKAKGLKVCVWINPYIAQNSELFAQGRDNGYFIKKKNGDVWQWDMWQPGMAVVDFTNDEAVKWYQGYLRELLDMGVDCFKTDFGEQIPTEGVCYHNGADSILMHNYYSYLYNEAVYNVILEERGADEAILFARSGTAGGQKFPVHWGGDSISDYESMEESLRGGLSLTMSGYSFWSHDIGGFEDTSSEDVYKRWVAFGLMSSHSRMHGSGSYRVPWNYGEDAVLTAKTFVRLKNRLMPYIYGLAVEAHNTGLPLMRSMILEYPDDKMCVYTDKQYMLGGDILVAPVFNEKSQADVYLPDGRWVNYFSNEVYDGKTWITLKDIPYTEIPCFVREGAVIAHGTIDSRPDYDYITNSELHVYLPQEGMDETVTLYNPFSGEQKEVNVTCSKGQLRNDAGIPMHSNEAAPHCLPQTPCR